jgi:hypothetical protein
MRWNDPLISGNRDGWAWIVCRGQIRELPQLVLDQHNEHRLAITRFDSGTITPSTEEQTIGWSIVGDAAIVADQLTDGTGFH